MQVYLAGQGKEHHDWKDEIRQVEGLTFYDWELDSDQSSPDTFFPDDLRGIRGSDILVADTWDAPSEATWIEIGYFYALNTKFVGELCNRLIIIWHEERQPKWSIEFVKKVGHVVGTHTEAIALLNNIVSEGKKADNE